MIRSMTGYGQASCHYNQRTIKVEFRSLNSKQLDLNIKIPNTYRDKEMELRSMLQPILERGKVEFTLSVEIPAENSVPALETKVMESYFKQLLPLATKYHSEPYLMPILMQMPGIWKVTEDTYDEEEWKCVEQTIEAALNEFDLFRMQEGDVLAKDFNHRITLIRMYLSQIENYQEDRINNVKQRLEKLLEEHVGKNNIDGNRLEQELIFYIDKMDFTEEKTRLIKHMDYFEVSLSSATSQGKKLGFIVQEMGREINTLGSKANHAEIQKLVVNMKEELEKIREQMMNIL